MTQEQTPPPGPELDRLVAEKMGYPLALGPNGTTYGVYYKVEGHKPYFVGVPDFSSDIEFVWRVVDFMLDRDYDFYVNKTKPRGWVAGFASQAPGKMCSQFLGDTAAHAICLAFLALPDDELEATQ